MLEIGCAILVLAGLLIYLLLDGFDMGVGNLFLFTKTKQQKDEMMSSLAPVWDGNETWLVYAGGMTWAAFPLVYSIALPAFYIPLTGMLFAIMLRSISFEFRLKANDKQKKLWDAMFFLGSFLMSFIQGAALGAIVNGVKIENNAYAGGAFDWLCTTTIATGLAVVIANTMLGAAWTIYKTEGETRSFAISALKKSAIGLAVAFVICAVYVPLAHPFTLDLLFKHAIILPAILISAVLTFALLFFIIKGADKCMYSKDYYPLTATFLVITLAVFNFV